VKYFKWNYAKSVMGQQSWIGIGGVIMKMEKMFIFVQKNVRISG